MKKAVGFFCLAWAFSGPVWASGQSASVYIGTPSTGASYQVDNARVSVGISELSIAVDGIWNLRDITGRPEFDLFYVYAGGIWRDDRNYEWGPQLGGGLNVPLGNGNMEFFAEGGTTWYIQDDSDLRLEGKAGLRVYF